MFKVLVNPNPYGLLFFILIALGFSLIQLPLPLPIVVGLFVPFALAADVFFFLWAMSALRERRRMKREEDA